MKKHILQQSEWEIQMADKILRYVQNELYFDMPYLSIALNALTWKADDTIETMATDGTTLFYNPSKMLSLFQKNQKYIDRAYLHSIFHCLFSHLFLKQERNDSLYSLACDIAVEYTIDTLNKSCTKRILSLTRKEVYEELKQLPGISAATLYTWLLTRTDLERLQYEFYTDDHRYWPKEQKSKMPNPSSQNTQDKWQKIARQTMLDQKKKESGPEAQSNLLASQIEAKKNERSYADFLRKFSIIKEELHPDPDAFDPIFYTYGLSLYKNMPLIEEVETKEVHKIQEFVIVIDTSYSTNGQLVKNFLEETYTLLSQSDSFFKQTHIHILQCDDKVQSDQVIRNTNDMEKLLHNFTVLGGGNTDFRPAFTYINELIQNKDIQNLSGVLYFTDGKGIYPKKRPEYKTAFLFLEDFDRSKVPPWAITLKLDYIHFLKGQK